MNRVPLMRPPRPFAALLWRELVELTRHSAPVFVLYCVFIFLDARPPATLRQVLQPAERFVWFGFFNVLVGSVFGFYQSARDRETDAWAFAVHRPVSRTRIFAAKLLAGWLTFLLVAGVPWAVAMAWIAIPGHIAVPFDWHMLQPGASDLLIGLTAHAGGLLVGARVRGAFSRYLGFVAVIVGGFVIASLPHFWGAAVMTVILTAVLLIAAWATFMSADDRAHQPALGRVAHALAVLPACLVLYLIGAMTWDAMTMDRGIPIEEQGAPIRQALVTPDGRIVKAKIGERSLPTGEMPYVEDAFDLDGRPLPEVATALSVSEAGAGVITSAQLRTYTTDFYRLTYRSPSRWVQRLAASKPGAIWYYERNRGLISVYSDSTRRRIGWIGPDGFTSSDTPPSRRFEGNLRTTWLMWDEFLVFDGAIYATGKFPSPPELIFRAPAGDTIADMAMTNFAAFNKTAMAPGPWTHFRAISTNRAIYIIDDANRVEMTSPKPTDLPKNALATVWRAPNAPGKPTFIWYPAWSDSLNRVLEYRMGSTQPVARYEFTGPMYETRYSQGSLGSRFIARSGGGGLVSMSSPTPLTALDMGWEIAGPGSERPSRRAIATSLTLSAITMVFIWLIGRRYAFSLRWRAAWMVLSIIAGPFTLLAMWLTTDFPARETCPSCGQPRVVNRESCEHCNAEYSAPDPDGTEVFA